MNHAQYPNDRPRFHDPIHIDNLYAFELDGGYNPFCRVGGYSSNEQHWSSPCVGPQLAEGPGYIDPIPRAPSLTGTLSSDNSHHGQPRSPYPRRNPRSYASSYWKETENNLSDNRVRRESCYSIEPERSGLKMLSTAEDVELGPVGGSTDTTVSSYEESIAATSSNADVDYSWNTTSFNEDMNRRLDLQDIWVPSPHKHSANCLNVHQLSTMISMTDIFGHASSMTVEDQGIPTGDDSSASSWIPASKELARTPSLSSTSATTSSMSKASSSVSESLQDTHCDYCNTTFTGIYRRGNLARHMRTRHTHKQMYTCPCPVCGRVYKRSDALRKHIRMSHGQSALQGHPAHRRKDHTFTAAFESHPTPSQGMDVTNTDAVIAPSITAVGTLPATEHQDPQPSYSCPEPGCTHVFERNAELIRHSRTHLSESERPYKCTHCDQSFLYPKDLRRHETTHSETNSGSIHCHVNSCSYGPGGSSFTRRDGLLRHMRRTHPDLD
jgi:uncharacterized C2H2 Zn-finger protein